MPDPRFGVKSVFATAPPLSRGTVPLSDNSPSWGAFGDEPQQQERRCANGLRQDFPSLIPAKPYAADYLHDGLKILGRSQALQKRHLQMNGPSAFRWMLHDIDRPGAVLAHRDANLPPPNIIMVNPENSHAHSAVLLEVPVARHSASRLAPLRYFAAVERGIARRLGADRHYSGLIAKNAVHADWQVEWRREQPYSLDELSDWLFPRDMEPDVTIATTLGAGRNVTVFDELRHIAYREVREFKAGGAAFEVWLARCEKLALALNMQFPRAMKLSEVRSISKSVAKWTWQRFSVERFHARQSYLGKRGNAKRWAGHVSIDKLEPWKALGISRRTYFRRKKAGAIQ